MRAKTSKRRPSMVERLYAQGEETVTQVLRDVFGVSDGVAKLLRTASTTSGRVERNVEVLLHLLNLPSRADYQKLLTKVEHLQGTLVNTNMKLDRLLAAQQRSPASAPKSAAKS